MLITAKINDVSMTAFADTGCAMKFESACFAKNLGLLIAPASKLVQMADSAKSSKVIGMI